MPARHATTHGIIVLAAVSSIVVGCAQTPLGPMVQVMPGPGKSFETFQADQSACKVYAADSVQGQAQAANNQAVGAAVLTTMLGAGLGAATGSAWGAAGQGAAIGAGAGAATGAAVGADMSSGAQMGIQQQYDNAFSQCMYAKGELVPGFAPPPQPAAVATGPDPALVHSVQVELIRLSYLKDTADGAQGPHTRAAIRDYEHANGLPVDGSSTPRLLAKLQATPTSQAAAPVASAPSGWVAPASTPGTQQGASAAVTPAAATGSAAPAGWVTPTKSP